MRTEIAKKSRELTRQALLGAQGIRARYSDLPDDLLAIYNDPFDTASIGSARRRLRQLKEDAQEVDDLLAQVRDLAGTL